MEKIEVATQQLKGLAMIQGDDRVVSALRLENSHTQDHRYNEIILRCFMAGHKIPGDFYV